MLPTSPTPLINPTTFPASRYANIGVFINLLGPLLITIALLIFGAMLSWSAYNYLTSAGDAEKVAKSKRMIVWSGIGLIVILSATLLVRIVGTVLNVQTVFDL